MRRLFTDNEISDIVSSIDIDELLDTRTLKLRDDVMVRLYIGNAGFDAKCYQWGIDGYGDNDWVETSSVRVVFTGDMEDDILYGISLVLQRAWEVECEILSE